ncbi:MAG: DUF3570 domain-containing protein [Candidatus Cloacimonetes bacterium]|nr:DUF3570 domain-containing protein [Candidatus Cloacimonadota bacterium]
MQLNTATARLSLAVASLLTAAGSPAGAAEIPESGNWTDGPARNRIEIGVLSYNESARVQVLEPVMRWSRSLGSERTLRVRLGYDSMTGASPNGAMPASHPQTFTSPSGNRYTVETGSQPTRSFRDDRYAFGLEYEQPLNRTLRLSSGLNLSKETDYFSSGASLSLAWDLDQRRTTVNLGASVTEDRVTPRGGMAVPLSVYGAGEMQSSSSAGKHMQDVLLGFTRILNERTVFQFNATQGWDQGYLTEPYKGVSLVDGETGALRGSRHESRPDTRSRTALYAKTAVHLPRDVVHLSYRWYNDDWGVTGHTVDLAYYMKLGRGHVLRPHLRWSGQSAADFHSYTLISGQTLPDYVSADSRLSDMSTLTAGLKYSLPLGPGTFSSKVEYMLQRMNVPSSQTPGVLNTMDVAPDLKVIMLSLGYDISF